MADLLSGKFSQLISSIYELFCAITYFQLISTNKVNLVVIFHELRSRKITTRLAFSIRGYCWTCIEVGIITLFWVVELIYRFGVPLKPTV